jgi:hypothetical protein
MRNWDQYLELWQQKRNELPVDTDAQTDWSEMHDLLDKHLPVQNPGSSGSDTGGQASNLAKQLSNLIKFKLFYVVGGLILAGAVTYTVMQHRAPIKDNKAAKTEIRKDSVDTHNSSVTDSLVASNNNSVVDNAGDHQNLASAAIPLANTPRKGDLNTGSSTINNKADAATIKSNVSNNSSAKDARILSSSNRLTNRSRSNSNGRSGSNTQLGDNNQRVNAKSDNTTGSGNDLTADSNYKGTQAGDPSSIATQGRHDSNVPLQIATATAFTWDDVVASNKPYTGSIPKYVRIRLFNNNAKTAKAGKNSTSNKNSKDSKRPKGGSNATPIDLDWGILAGVNSDGGFTSKAQNHNFYGSLSPDIYLGLFSTYNLNDRWAVGLQTKFFTPHTISGTYNYTHKLKADTVQTSQNLTISDSRKVYTIDVPIYAIYKASPNVSFKAGAILSMPVKQVNGTNSFTISGLLRDSAVYYNSVTNDINASTFDKKIRVGASAGISFTYRAVWLDATYNLQGIKVNSALGGYNANANSLQLTVGFKFNKSKK